MTFDSWEVLIRPPEDCLEHHGIRGMKHGRRRYQNEDGTWTDEGLAARKKREGWGDSGERKAKRYEKKAAKYSKKMHNAKNDIDAAKAGMKVSEYIYKRNKARGLVSKEEAKEIEAHGKLEKKELRLEEREYNRQVKAARRQAAEEKRRTKSLNGLTDEEMKAKLERAKMEAEYRDLTRRHTAIETGANLIGKYLEYRNTKEKNAIEANKQKLEMERLKTQRVQAKEASEKAASDAKASKFEFKKMKQDRKAGLSTKRQKELIGAKLAYRNTTVRGGIAKRINQFLTSGKSEYYQAKRKAKGEAAASKIKNKAEDNESLETKDKKARKRLGLS